MPNETYTAGHQRLLTELRAATAVAAQRESSMEEIGPSSPLRNAEEPPNLAVPKALHVMEHDDRALTIGQQVQRFG